MGTVVGAWRLKTMIILFIFVIIIYTVYGLFSSVQTDEYGYINNSKTTLDINQSEETLKHGNSLQDIIFGLGDFLTFSKITEPIPRFIINIMTSICFITIIYIGYTFLKEWIPFT